MYLYLLQQDSANELILRAAREKDRLAITLPISICDEGCGYGEFCHVRATCNDCSIFLLPCMPQETVYGLQK